MTDMSHSSFEEVDEFGGLAHLVLPGQDPELLHGLHAALTAQMKPTNFIDRMWVRDMAIQIARIEYLRMADCAVHRHVRDEASVQPGSNAQENGLQQRSNEALGEAFVQHIALFSALIELEQEVMRERDRLILQYERRSATVKAYEDAIAAVAQNRYEPADG